MNESITVEVFDRDWDRLVHTEVGDVRVLELGHLLITDKDDKPMTCYAPGAWAMFQVTR